MDEPTKSSRVEKSVKNVIEDEALQDAELRFGQARVFLSKRSQLDDEPSLDNPQEYPDVPTNLKDDADSWLK